MNYKCQSLSIILFLSLFLTCYLSDIPNTEELNEAELIYEVEKLLIERRKTAMTDLDVEEIDHVRSFITEYKNTKTILNSIMSILFGGSLCLILDKVYGKEYLWIYGYVCMSIVFLVTSGFIYFRTRKSKYSI